MELEVRLSGFRELAQRFRTAQRIITEELGRAMLRVVLAGERRSKQIVKKDTSNLARSITHESRSIGGAVRGAWGTSQPYARPVEEGRRAGAAMPPRGALLGWMRRKGIDARLEFVVRRGIARRGIPPAPFIKRALAELRPQINAEFAAATRRIVARLRG